MASKSVVTPLSLMLSNFNESIENFSQFSNPYEKQAFLDGANVCRKLFYLLPPMLSEVPLVEWSRTVGKNGLGARDTELLIEGVRKANEISNLKMMAKDMVIFDLLEALEFYADAKNWEGSEFLPRDHAALSGNDEDDSYIPCGDRARLVVAQVSKLMVKSEDGTTT